jgi:hypothetical protein
VIVGKKIPAGTGMRKYDRLQVTGAGRPFRDQQEEVVVEDEA